MSTFEDTAKAHHSQKGTMEMTSPNADELNTAVQQWVLTAVVPALAERGALPPEAAAAIASVAAPGTPPERRREVADELRDTSWSLDPADREIIWLLARVLSPRSRWSLDPVSLPDKIIDALGLRRVTMLARADEAVLEALVRHHPKVAAMSAAMDMIERVKAELAGRGWTPEVQRLAWAAAQLADTAELSVVFDTSPDGLRLMIIDDEVLLDAPYRLGIDQGGYRIRAPFGAC